VFVRDPDAQSDVAVTPARFPEFIGRHMDAIANQAPGFSHAELVATVQSPNITLDSEILDTPGIVAESAVSELLVVVCGC
jgi:hypothetical protein